MIAGLNSVPNANVDPVIGTITNRPRVDFYKIREELDPFPDPSLLDMVDSDQHAEIDEALHTMVRDAVELGLPEDKEEDLRKIVFDRKDVFRVNFSSGPPAKIKPLKIELTPEARPVRVRLRNYSQDQRAFLKKFVDKLLKAGMAYPNPTSPWACAPLLFPKPGPAEFRFTVDLRPVNRFTVCHQFPMPYMDQELTRIAGSKFYCNLDFNHSYRQLPLDKDSQVTQSFITPDGILTPTRVLHGTTNAVMYLQSTLSSCLPDELLHTLLWWLDDILVHSKTVSLHLEGVRRLLDFCVRYNLKLHPLKFTLYCTSLRWCGRQISADRVRFDPRRIDGIKKLRRPNTGAELQQFVCAMQWMRSDIPMFSSLIRPLSTFLEKVYTRAGKRTRLAAAEVSLESLNWSEEEDGAVDKCKLALENQATLVHQDAFKRLCVFTDASELLWSGVVTQVPQEDLSKPFEDQRHEPMCSA